MTLALALQVDGEPARASRAAAAALNTVSEAKHAVLEGISRCVCCVLAMAEGDADACVSHLERAEELLGESDWGEGNSMLAMAKGCAAKVRGDTVDAPDLSSVFHARARIGWRLIMDEGQQAATSSPAPVQPTALPSTGVVVHRAGRWFSCEGNPPVDLTRKRTLRPMLLVLAKHREEAPGEALDVDTLFSAVWQGERALPAARKNRVYVAIATLRKAGLETLTTRGDGYLLRPDADIHWAD
jgi:hypothetical protein